ncbi:hypothetical protein [Terrisporobacter petrolearius]|uniref:hypothetical protein n=1 Tax=Terrisporobacter petrolearius TaxID=1460447 RepID=UPI003B003B86
MNLLKKVTPLLLSLAIVIGSIFVGTKTNSYAATSKSYIKELKIGKTYYYNLDGGKYKDKIKVYVSKNDNLLLRINDKTIKVLKYDYEYSKHNYNRLPYKCNVRIYNFNKKDKSLEIVLNYREDLQEGYRILKFKNSKCLLDKIYNDSYMEKYDSNTGAITLSEGNWGLFKDFTDAIGRFGCYYKIQIKGYKIHNPYTSNTTEEARKFKYTADKNLNAYTNTNSSKIAFTVKRDEKVNIYSFYQKGNKKYIKVKNSSGKYGYIKIGSSPLFEEWLMVR